jgi:hypothetical protein
VADYRYALEKFGTAVRTLATSAAPPKKRLQMAAEGFLVLQEAQIPEDLGETWQGIRQSLTRRPGPDPRIGSLVATTDGVRTAEAEAVAERIVDFYSTLQRRYGYREGR